MIIYLLFIIIQAFIVARWPYFSKDSIFTIHHIFEPYSLNYM